MPTAEPAFFPGCQDATMRLEMMLLLRSLYAYRPVHCSFSVEKNLKQINFFCNSGRNYLKVNLQNDISGPNQGCRIDWWVFRLDLITGSGHNTNFFALKSCFNARTIGNQKEQMVQTNSAPALFPEHIFLCYT